MEQQIVLTQTTQSEIPPITFWQRWMRYFFTDDLSPDNRPIVDLQRRACWISVALILQSLDEIDHNWYIPYLMPFGSLIPLTLIVGSFFAIWMAFRPTSPKQVLSPFGGKGKNRARASLYRFPRAAAPWNLTGHHPQRWQRTVLVLTLILGIIGMVEFGRGIIMSIEPPQMSNDGTSIDTNAAALLLQGRNPYTDSSMLDLARRFHIHPDWTTPLRQGEFANRLDYPSVTEFQTVLDTDLKNGSAPEFESKVSYPSLSFLTLVPFVWLNNYNVLPLYLLSYVLIVAIAWKVARPELRPWVLLLGAANVPMWASTVGGNLDILYTLLVVMVWLLRDRRWGSAIFLGLALATKQLAWFFTPFYIVMIWRQYGWREAVLRVIVAGGIGLLLNLPFILWNPQAWLAGVLAPMVDPMFPLGVGIINLSATHLLPYFPWWVYAGLEAVAMLLTLAWYWKLCLRQPEAALLLAIIPLFFAWRSLPSYFTCAAYPLFILMAARVFYRAGGSGRRAESKPLSLDEPESIPVAPVAATLATAPIIRHLALLYRGITGLAGEGQVAGRGQLHPPDAATSVPTP